MDSKKAINEYKKLLEDNTKYSLIGQMDIVSNEELYHYDVKVDYMEGDYYKASLVNKENDHEQIILKNKSGVYVVTPSLNKSFKFQSEWPYNSSQAYILSSLLKDLENDSNVILEEKEEYVALLNSVAEANDYYLVALFITDIIHKGSYVLYSNRAENVLRKVYKDEKLTQGTFLKGVVSRKKQILPGIMLEMGEN